MNIIRIEEGDESHAPFVEVGVEDHDFAQHQKECNHRRYYSPMARIQIYWRKVVAVSDRFDRWCGQSALHTGVAVLGGFFFLYLIFGVTMAILYG